MAQIDLDLTVPVQALRALTGDVDKCDPIISDNMYQSYIDKFTNDDRNECVVLWLAAIESMTLIMKFYATEGERRRERVNAVEVENYGAERYRSYKNALEWLKGNPPLDCPLSSSLFHFGGTYDECDQIYTLKYIYDCSCYCWPRAWRDGYYLSLNGGTIYRWP